MKRFITIAFFLTGFAVLGWAQDHEEFEKWMKSVGGEMGALRKNETKTGPEAVASGEKIAAVYEQLTGYFAKQNVADAVKWSQDGKAAADSLAAAAKAGDSDKAKAAVQTIGGTCKGCHDAHREKDADGHYKFK